MIPSRTVVRTAIGVLRVVPFPVARALGWMAGSLAYVVAGERRRTILGNLERTASGVPPGQRRRLARRTFRNMVDAALHLYRLPSMSREELLGLVAFEGEEHLRAALAMQRGVIIVTAHLGPYELGGAWLAATGVDTHAMVEDLAPEVLDAMAAYRRATGMGIISMKQGIREVFRLLERNAVVLLVADRAIGDTRGVVEMPFAGGVRPLPTGPATFAVARGTPIIAGRIIRNPARRPRYLVRFEAPVVPEGRSEAERLRLTRHIAARLSAAVHDHPDQWYVFQPQWVTDECD